MVKEFIIHHIRIIASVLILRTLEHYSVFKQRNFFESYAFKKINHFMTDNYDSRDKHLALAARKMNESVPTMISGFSCSKSVSKSTR